LSRPSDRKKLLRKVKISLLPLRLRKFRNQ